MQSLGRNVRRQAFQGYTLCIERRETCILLWTRRTKCTSCILQKSRKSPIEVTVYVSINNLHAN